jgi:ribosome-binding ATPase YchF (GTP1/OBG family)
MMLIGVVGKPNVGKSTFFKALTLADVLIANYPFATIKPNEGFGHVRVECIEKFFNVKCNPRFGYCEDGERFVPVKVIDVAGLVPGAHEGKGMGNQFLDDLNQANALIHVIDCAGTTNELGEPVPAGSYDPEKDILFLEEELDFWYLRILKDGWEKLFRRVLQEKQDIVKILSKQMSGLGVSERMVEEVFTALSLNKDELRTWTDDTLLQIAVGLRKKTKPMVIACNKVDISTGKANFERLKAKHPELIMIPCSAESELALKEASKHQVIKYLPGDKDFRILDEAKLNDKQKNALNFIKANVLDKFGSTGVQKMMNTAVFDLLKYMAIFPGGIGKLQDKDGRTLPDCFLLPPSSTALDFAFFLHTDLGNGFIRAIDVKSKRTVGKDFLLHHLDVIEIISDK